MNELNKLSILQHVEYLTQDPLWVLGERIKIKEWIYCNDRMGEKKNKWIDIN